MYIIIKWLISLISFKKLTDIKKKEIENEFIDGIKLVSDSSGSEDDSMEFTGSINLDEKVLMSNYKKNKKK